MNMTNNLQKNKFVQAFLRAHSVAKLRKTRKAQRFIRRDPKWTKYVIVVDCETTRDTIQGLTFGSGRFCRWDPVTKTFVCIEETYFYADAVPETNPEGYA